MRTTSIIHDLTNWIEDNLDKVPLSVSLVSKKSGYSLWHLQRMFKQETGLILGSYLRGRRLSQAAQALQFTQLPIQEIALLYGFDSQPTFTRTFKQHFNQTPAQYRKNDFWNASQMTLPVSLLDDEFVAPQFRIVELPKQYFTLSAENISFSIKASNRKNIHFCRFRNKHIKKLNPISPASYGFLKMVPDSNTVQEYHLMYIPAFSTDKAALPLDKKSIIETVVGKYACFSYKGTRMNFARFLAEVYGYHLPKLGLTRRKGHDMPRIFHDESSIEHSGPEAIISLDYYIPIH